MSAIYLLTVFFNLCNFFIIFIHINNNFSISWMGPCHCLVKIVTSYVSSVAHPGLLLIPFYLLFYFVVVRAAGRKSTTKCSTFVFPRFSLYRAAKNVNLTAIL
jgi:hypothetical protein